MSDFLASPKVGVVVLTSRNWQEQTFRSRSDRRSHPLPTLTIEAEQHDNQFLLQAISEFVDSKELAYVFIASDPLELFEEEIVAATVAAGSLGASVIYGDALVQNDRVREVLLRPNFSPERLRCQFYFGPLVGLKVSLWAEFQQLMLERPGAELYSVVLAAHMRGYGVQHLNMVLGSFRDPLNRGAISSQPWEIEEGSTSNALVEYLAATGGGEVRSIGKDGIHRTVRNPLGRPLVSVVIPTRGKFSSASLKNSYLLTALKSIVEKSTYENLEFVLVVDANHEVEIEAATREMLGTRLNWVVWDRPFNFSDKVNFGVVHSAGEYLLILNDDVEVISADWIERLLALAQLPGAGMAGALLYFEDDTIQHAGHAYHAGEASHIGLDQPREAEGPLMGFRVEREAGGVTAACAMMPRSVYFEAGGFTGLLPGNFNDVDLCMKVTQLGYKIYWTCNAELYHFESKTRDATVLPFEIEVTWGRWAERLKLDSFWPYELDREPIRWQLAP